MTPSSSSTSVQKTFLKYQHVLVFLAPLAFVVGVYLFAPTESATPGTGYWLEYWWLFIPFVIGATIVNTVGISGSALFVPFLIFIFPLVAYPLEPETLVKIGLLSESFGLSSSSLAFIQHGLVDRRLALSLVLGGIPFVVTGAFLSFMIPEPVFHALLAVALLTAAYLLFEADLAHEEPDATGDSTMAADGGLPNDAAKPGVAGVRTAENGTVTRADRNGTATSTREAVTSSGSPTTASAVSSRGWPASGSVS